MNTSNIIQGTLQTKRHCRVVGSFCKILQRWDREGILKANRTPTDRRYYTHDQYLQFKSITTENNNR